MEMIFLLGLPFLFLLLAGSMLAVSQISGFFQFNRFWGRERSNRKIISGFMEQMALAQAQLASRTRQLEELSRKLKLNNEELARLNSLKSKFLSMVVHDLRTPLTSISGYGDMLDKRGNWGAQEKKFLSYIMQASSQINRLVEDLTDLAVIEAGKLRMEKSAFDLAGFVSELAPPIGLAAAKKGVVLGVGELPQGVMVTADRFRLGRVLTNLLGNAMKFTPAGGKVDLRVRVIGGEAQFYVRDTGPGIHPLERRRIFEKFYQSRHLKDKTARSAGWGLGLAISEEIVRAHGGRIGVESPGLGKGSTFWVRVPLIPARSRMLLRPLAQIAAAALFFLARPASAQNIPLEEKARYEAALETRVEAILLRILGPNRSKVVVDATLDFTRIEKYETKMGTATLRYFRNVPYLWTAPNAPPTAAQTELLPGVPLRQAPQEMAGAPPPPQSYERMNTYPNQFVKRLAVTLILDRSVTEVHSNEISTIVADLLKINADRGDILTVVHTSFTPIWKTVWYAPETASVVIKYLLVSLMALMTLLVIAACFLKLAGAMSAMARSQSQQITMEMRGAAGGGPAGLLGTEEAPGTPGAKAKELEAAAEFAEAQEEVVFNVRPDQVEALADMLKKEEPANIALVASHLRPELRQALLKGLPADVAEEVMVSLGRVRYVEPEVIANLKDELERRLAGAVGGLGRLIEMVSASEMGERRRILDGLRAKDPELAEEVRRRVFLLEDLARLSRDEWSLLNSRIGYEDWAAALSDGPQSVVDALRQSMTEGAWKVLEQMIAAKTADAKTRAAAQEKVAKAVSDLVASGRMLNPSSREPKRLEAQEPQS